MPSSTVWAGQSRTWPPGAKLQEAKKQLVSVQDNLDTATPNGRLLFNLLATISDYERELLMERTKAERERAAQQGVQMHRPRIELDLTELKSLYQKAVPSAQLVPGCFMCIKQRSGAGWGTETADVVATKSEKPGSTCSTPPSRTYFN